MVCRKKIETIKIRVYIIFCINIIYNIVAPLRRAQNAGKKRKYFGITKNWTILK